MTILGRPAGRAERAAGIPLARYRPEPARRRPHPPDRRQMIMLSNDAAHDPRRPFWIVGHAAEGPGEADRPWHASRYELWAGEPPDDGAARMPHPCIRQLAGHDARHQGARPVVPRAVSWDHGATADSAGVVWFSDGSTLPLQSYLALLHHAGARASGEPPLGTVTWTPARRWLQAELDGVRIAALARLKRSAARDAQARTAMETIDR